MQKILQKHQISTQISKHARITPSGPSNRTLGRGQVEHLQGSVGEAAVVVVHRQRHVAGVARQVDILDLGG